MNKLKGSKIIKYLLILIVLLLVITAILWVSFFPRESSYNIITMPDIIGDDFNEAVLQYPKLDFQPIWEHSAEFEKGQIIRQSILPGRNVKEGLRIDVWVSLGGPEENGENE